MNTILRGETETVEEFKVELLDIVEGCIEFIDSVSVYSKGKPSPKQVKDALIYLMDRHGATELYYQVTIPYYADSINNA